MTGFLLAVMPLVVLVTMQFRRSVQQSYRRIRVAIARINSYLAGAHQRHRRSAALQSRSDAAAPNSSEINRDHMEAFKDAITAYGWFYPVIEFLGMLALALLLGLRRLPHSRRRADARRAGGVLPIRPAILPPHSGSEREVQHPAIGHGRVRARLQAARHAGADSVASAARSRFRKRPPPSNSTTSGSPTKTKTGC